MELLSISRSTLSLSKSGRLSSSRGDGGADRVLGELFETYGMALKVVERILLELSSICKNVPSKDQETAPREPNPIEIILSYVEDIIYNVLHGS